MPANKNRRTELLNSVGQIRQQVVTLYFPTNGATTVVPTAGLKGWVSGVVRSNTGTYDITLPSGVPETLYTNAELQSTTFGNVKARISAISATAGTLTVNLSDSAGANIDVAANAANIIRVVIVQANTGVSR